MAAYTIQLRSYQGQVLGTRHGHTDWQRTLARLAQSVGVLSRGSRDEVAVDNYFPTDAGRPWGTHHIQFGHYNHKAGGTVLSSAYVVSVQPA